MVNYGAGQGTCSDDVEMNIVNALTVDVEDYFHVSALASAIGRDTWADRESRVAGNIDKLLALFDKFNARATFFVLGWVAERDPHLVRSIARHGHEIACHGWSHRLVYDQPRGEFYEETRRAKELLEDITGSAVLGYRAASYSIVRRSLWALDVLVDLGFSYDSSIFPVRHDRYGIPDAQQSPHRLSTPGGQHIVEWPLSTVSALGLRIPVSGGGYLRILPFWLTRWGLRSINRQERPFIFYLHPWEVDPAQPRVSAGWLSRFRHYTNLDKTEGRLEVLLKDFRFGPAIDGLVQLGLLSERPGKVQAVSENDSCPSP